MTWYMGRKFIMSMIGLIGLIVLIYMGKVPGDSFQIACPAILAAYGFPNFLDKKNGGEG